MIRIYNNKREMLGLPNFIKRLFVSLVCFLLSGVGVYAQFGTTRTSVSGHYKIVMIGASSIGPNTGACLGAASSNNTIKGSAAYLTSDGSTSTNYLDSYSSATVSSSLIPTGCAKVAKAYLYWGGSDYTNKANYWEDSPTIIDPAGGSHAVSYSAYGTTAGTADGDCTPYWAFADVSTALAGQSNGTFAVKGIAADINDDKGGPVCGWTLILLYEDNSYPETNFYLYDGAYTIGDGSGLSTEFTKNINFTSFPSGVITGTVGMAGFDGDVGSGNIDNVTFKTTNGTSQDLNTLKGSNDFFNSTMTYDGASVNHTPDCVNTVGFDVHQVELPVGAVTNSDAAATIDVKTGDSFIAPFMMYVAIRSEVPHLTVTKTPSSSSVSMGENFKYFVVLNNDGGKATAAGSVVTDTLDYNVDLVANSVKYTLDGITSTATYTFNTSTRQLNITGLPAIPSGDKLVLSYQVKVKDATRADLWREDCMHTIYNMAKATYYDELYPSNPLYAYSGAVGCGAGEYTKIPITADYAKYYVTEVNHNVTESNNTIVLSDYLKNPVLTDELGATDYALTGTDGTPTYSYYKEDKTTAVSGYLNIAAGETQTYYAIRNVTTLKAKGSTCPDVIKIILNRATCKLTTATLDVTDALCNGKNNGTVSLLNVATAQNMSDGAKYSLYKGTYTSTDELPSGNPAYSYSTNSTDVSALSHTFSDIAAGDYTIVFKDGLGCKILKNATVKEPDPIAVTITHTNACIGSRVRFTANTTGGITGTEYSYKWYRSSDGGSTYIEDNSQGDGNIYDVTSSQNSIYVKAVATSTSAECGNVVCQGEGTDNVTLSVKPDLSLTGSKLCKGESFTLTPTDANSSNVVNYTWEASSDSINWTTVIDKSTSTTDKSYTVTPTDSMYYRTVYTTLGGCTDSADAKIAVFPLPVISNKTETICSGESFNVLPVDGTDGDIVPAGTTYTWTVASNANVTGSSSQTVAKTSISQTLESSSNAAQTLTYTVTPKTEHPCTGSTFTITVTVNPKPAITNITASQCSGTTFSVTPANTINGLVPAGTTYSWSVPTAAGVTGMTAGSGSLIISQTLTNTTTANVDVTYIVKPKSGDCEGEPFNVTFTVKAKPIITVVSPSEVCAPNTVNIVGTASGADTYAYYSDAAATTVVDNTTYSGAQTTDYYVVGTTNSCASDPVKGTVTIDAQPTAPTSGGNKSFCEGSTVPELSVTVGSGETADWYADATGGTSLISGSTSYTPAAPASAGDITYYVEARNTSTGCISANRTAVKITMKAKPITPNGSDYSSCPSITAGTKSWASLVSNYTGTLNWYTSADVATSDPGSFATETEMSLTKYKVTQTINGCESEAATVTAKINNVASAPTIVPYDECAASVSSTKAWSSLITTTGTQTWYSSDGTVALGGEPSAFDISKAMASTSYQVTVTDANGCVSPKTVVSAQVKARPTASISGDATICSDYTGTTPLNITFTGTPNFTYALDDGSTNGTATSTSQTVNMANPSNTTTYKIYSLSDANCTAISSDLTGSATITVTPKPTAEIDYTTPVCNSITSNPVSITGTNAYTGGSYSSTTGLSIDASSGKIDPSASTAGSYTVTYTIPAANGCSVVKTTKDISITDLPTITKLEYADNPFCSTVTKGSPTLEGTDLTGGVYTSSPSGLTIDGTTGEINPSASTAGTYTVTYTIPAANGCSAVSKTTNVTITTMPSATISYVNSPYCKNLGSQDVTLTGVSGGTYSSTTGLTIDASSGSITPSTSTAGNYTVTYTVAAANGCPSITPTASIKISDVPTINVSTAETCDADKNHYSVSFTVSDGNVTSTYGTVTNTTGNIWKVYDINAGTDITATVTTSDGCIATKSISAPDCSCDVINAPTGTTNYSYCAGSTIPTITAASSNTTLYGITWYDAETGGNVLKSNSTTYTPTAAGTYYAEAYDYATESTTKCHSSRTAFIVTENARPTVTVSGDATICKGNSANLNMTLTGTAPYNYELNNGTIKGTSATIGVTPDATTKYTVTSLSDANCKAEVEDITGSATITITDKPEVPNITAPDAVCDGSNLSLTVPSVIENGATTTGIFKMSTTVGGTTYAELASPYTVSYADNGKSLIYTATNACGNVSNDPVTITVNKAPAVSAISAPDAVCSGSKLNLKDPTVTEYGVTATSEWQIENIAGSGNYISFDPATAVIISDNGKKIRYSAATACGTTYSNAVTVTVNALPTAEISGTTDVCANNNSAALTVKFNTGTAPYSFGYNDGVSTNNKTGVSDNPYTFTVTPTSTTTYTLSSLIDNNGCSAISDGLAGSAIITVNPMPTITVSTAASCSDDLSTYSVSVDVANASSVTSTITGTSTPEGTISNSGNIYTVSGITKGTNITITAKGITPTYCSKTLDITAPDCNCGIIDAPTSGGDKSYCDYATPDVPSISATAPSGSNLVVDWYETSTGGNAVLSASNTYSPGVAGTYYAETRNKQTGCTSSTRTAVTITKNTVPSVSVIGANNNAVINCTNTNYTLGYSLSSETAASQKWSDNSTNSTLIVSDAGTYNVEITTDKGCIAKSNDISLTKDVAAATPSVNATVETLTCINPKTDLSTTNVTGASYKWTKDGTEISGATSNEIDNINDAADYEVTITYANGCSATSAAKTIAIDKTAAKPLISADYTTLTCTNPTANLKSSTTGSKYDWTKDGAVFGSNDQIVSTEDKGKYVVSVTYANGCSAASDEFEISLDKTKAIISGNQEVCVGSNISLSSTLAGGTGWKSSDLSVATITSGGSLTGNAAGQSNITYVGVNGCESDNYPVSVIAQPTITLTSGSDNQTLCSVNSKATISDITYTLGGSATNASITGLPSGVNGTYNSASKTFVISGIASSSIGEEDNYSLTTVNNAVCSTANVTGKIKINVTPDKPSVTNYADCSVSGTKSWIDLATPADGATLNWYDVSNTAISSPSDFDKSDVGTITYLVSQTKDGCEGEKSTVSATVYALPTATISGDNTVCKGSSSTLNVGFSNGKSPYSYKLVTGENGDNITTSSSFDVSPSITTTYKLSEVKDANGCFATSANLATTSATINVNPTPTSNAGADQTINGICNSSTTTATLAATLPSIGTGAWSFVSGTTTPKIEDATKYNFTVSGLGVGSYTFRWTVTSGTINACTATDDVTINVNADVSAPNFTQGTIADQSASRTANDCEFAVPNVLNLVTAKDDYTSDADLIFSQSPVAGTIITGNTNVTVTVSDACGNSNTQIINVVLPDKVTASINNIKDVSCNGSNDGVAVVEANGGSNSYSYSWKDASGVEVSTSATASNLYAGTYVVTVTDDNKCSATVNNIVVKQPDVINATFEVTNPKCNGNSGSITVKSISGGSGNYEYSLDNSTWTAISVGLVIPNIKSVTTTIYVRDASAIGCIKNFDVTMKIPSTVTASAAWVSDVTCKGLKNGSASATAQGGTGNYTYKWIDAYNNVASEAQSPTNLVAGKFTVTASDENGCQATSSEIEIKEPDAILGGSVVVTDIKCNGGKDGVATVTATGGTAPYTYLWDTNANSQTTNVASDLSKGAYTVTITDNNGCKATSTANISQPTALVVSIDATKTQNISCYNKYDGSLTATTSGGTPSYSYKWNDDNSSTTNVVSGLEGGDYTVVVTDANGCMASASTSLANPKEIIVTTSPINPKCYGGEGYAIVNISGGTSNSGVYQYSNDESNWSDITSGGKTSELYAGTYTIFVKDSKGCEGNASVTITQPEELKVSASAISDIKCNGQTNGVAAMTVDNAAGNSYSLVWYDDSYNEVNNISRPRTLKAGKYMVEVTDKFGCTASSNWIEIKEPTAVTVVSEIINPECPDQTSSMNVEINGGTVTNGYKYQLNSGDWNAIASKGTVMNIPLGAYMIIIKDDNDCTAPAISGNAYATDNKAPDVICHSDAEVEPVPGTCSYTIPGSAFDVQYHDNCSIKSVTHDYAYASDKTTLANAVITGSATITWTVTDVMNNTSTCKTKITVSDLEKPVIGKPVVDDTLTVSANYVSGSSCKFTVPDLTDIVQKVSSDNCTSRNDLQVQQTLATGSAIPSTITNNIDIYVSVIDEAGNISGSSVIKVLMPTIPKAKLVLSNDEKTVCNNSDKFLLPGSTDPVSSFTGTYSGTGAVGNYFSPSVAGVGTHTITYTVSPYGCSSNASADIMVLQSPVVTLPNASSVCPNKDLEFDAVTTPSGNDSYTWTLNGKTDANQTTSKYIVDNTSVSGTYTVGVVATDEFGCSSNAVDAIGIVNSNPIDPDVTVCSICKYGGNKSWSSLVKNSSGTLKWYDSESSITPISTPSIINDTVLGTRTYWVTTLSDANCESNKMKVTATVYPNPVVTNITSQGIKNVEVTVDQGTSPYTYNLGSSMTGSFTQTAELGTLSIGSFKILIEDANGCKTDTTIDIEPVDIEPDKYFTPNGDGINDLWTIKGIDYYPNSDIYIHDRYGKELAHYKGSDFKGWDGKYRGEDQVSTDYWYIILVKETGKRKVGHFLLKR